jgi:NADPH-dependent ferric siderophore reductase
MIMFSPKQQFLSFMTSTADVTEAEIISPRLHRILLKGISIEKLKWGLGDKIKILIGSKLCQCTPTWVNTEEGWMEFVVLAHGNDPLSQWARSVSSGDQVQFFGPAYSINGLERRPDWVIFLGDETSVGLALGVQKSLPASVHVRGAIEVATEDIPSIEALQLPIEPLVRDRRHGEALHTWLVWLTITSNLKGNGVIWIAGKASTVHSLKKTLLNYGLKPHQLKLQPLWEKTVPRYQKLLQLQSEWGLHEEYSVKQRTPMKRVTTLSR